MHLIYLAIFQKWGTVHTTKHDLKQLQTPHLKLWMPARSLFKTSWEVEIRSNAPMNSLSDRSLCIVGWVSWIELIIFNCRQPNRNESALIIQGLESSKSNIKFSNNIFHKIPYNTQRCFYKQNSFSGNIYLFTRKQHQQIIYT